jgi:lysozyme
MPAQYTFGFDVSRYQENVQWDRVKAAGMEFVIVQVSQYNWVDKLFPRHWANAKGVLPRGPYHFYRQITDPQKQVDVFLKALGDDPGELPPVLDIEDKSSNGKADYIKGARFWLEQVEKKLNRKPIIYTAAWYWANPQFMTPPSWASDYPLWVASYPFSQGAPTRTQVAKYPDKPPKERYPIMPSNWKKWTLWQYVEHGVVDGNFRSTGSLADTDFDAFNGPLEDLLKMATGATMPLPEPPKNPPPTTQVMLNQNVINAFSWAFQADWEKKMKEAGLSLTTMVNNRNAPYTGKPVKDMSLAEADKTVLQGKWDTILAKQ